MAKRILTISDLHIDVNQIDQVTNLLSDLSEARHASTILIGGDVSDNVDVTIEFIHHLNRRKPTYYVPGNHDLWNKDNSLLTQDIWRRYEQDQLCLLGRSIPLTNQTTLIGHIGWYDYSFANPSFSLSHLAQRELDGIVWQDREYVHFDMPDHEICEIYNNRIAELIDDESQNPNSFIVLMTHMVNHEALTVPHDDKRNWDYFNGFLGSKRLQHLTKKAQVAICGHVHFRKEFVENQTTYLCACLGYSKEWQYYDSDLSLAHQLSLAAKTFEVPE